MWKHDLVLYLCWITDQEEAAACSGSRVEISAPQLRVREEQGQPGDVYTAPSLF